MNRCMKIFASGSTIAALFNFSHAIGGVMRATVVTRGYYGHILPSTCAKNAN
jgi:hypothetical protein